RLNLPHCIPQLSDRPCLIYMGRLSSRNMEYPLTSRQQRFVELYSIDRCGTQAAIGAGYTDRPAAAAVTASRLLRKPNVQAALQAQEARIAADLEVGRQRVLDGLLEAVEMARQRADPAAMISAWREVGRLC